MTACRTNRSRVERPWRLDTWQVSWGSGTRDFAVRVRTDSEGRIVDAAPLVRRFVGQKLDRLVAWAKPGTKVELLKGAKR